jgi:hypothetical protein
LNELKKLETRFVDIPVGGFKPSHLHLYPQLKIVGAPTVRFVQENNKDLCVPKSLAWTFFMLGFCEQCQATKIAEFGRQELAGGAVDAIGKVKAYADESMLPTWIQSKKPLLFDWKQDLDERTVYVDQLSRRHHPRRIYL